MDYRDSSRSRRIVRIQSLPHSYLINFQDCNTHVHSAASIGILGHGDQTPHYPLIHLKHLKFVSFIAAQLAANQGAGLCTVIVQPNDADPVSNRKCSKMRFIICEAAALARLQIPATLRHPVFDAF